MTIPSPGASDEQDAGEDEGPWWRDREVLLPLASTALFLIGLVCQFTGARIPALAVFWAGLIAGASTFVPGALKALITRGRLGIGLLMTISAVGAVLLGQVEEAAALAFLYSISESLEDRAMDRARSGLSSLLRLVPETALVQRSDGPAEIPVEDLQPGDVLLVRAGDRVATDGVIVTGGTSLDLSAITGESIPISAGPGDDAPAGAVNTSGVIEVRATAPGTDNSLTTIVSLVEQAQADKGSRARLADRIAKPLVPGVLILAVLVGALGSVFGDPGVWITRSLVVLVAASPCALAIAVPVTVVSAIGAASRFGVVITSGAAFERFGGIRHVALDKTGTLTHNRPEVVDVITADGFSTDQVLAWAGALERTSSHPLAAAITRSADAHAGPVTARGVVETPGCGVSGQIEKATIMVGSPRWHDAGGLAVDIALMESKGITSVLVWRDSSAVGAIGVRDELRAGAAEAVSALRAAGIDVTMLTGDNPRAARVLAGQAGIEDVRAGLRPEEKSEAVTELCSGAPTAMIGDGINDAPALAAADVGIAMGVGGSDAAIESADVAFTGQDLRLLPRAFAHARRARRIMNQNLVLAILIIAALLPLAVTGVLGLAQVVLIHEGAEVLVILNGMRAARTRA